MNKVARVKQLVKAVIPLEVNLYVYPRPDIGHLGGYEFVFNQQDREDFHFTIVEQAFRALSPQEIAFRMVESWISFVWKDVK